MYATTKRRQDEAVVTVETLAPLTGDWVAVLGTGAGACVSAGAGTGAGASACLLLVVAYILSQILYLI